MSEMTVGEMVPPGRERIYRRNFVFFLIDGVLFEVALGIIGSNTVIPDFVRRLTDSEILIGLSGSLFAIGWTLPQLLVARYIVRSERKKWWFVGPNLPVRLVILIFGVLLFLMGAREPGTILLLFFVLYGLAALGDGLVGVPWSDLAGTSLDARWRARMFGVVTATSGVIMLGVVPLVGLILAENAFPVNYALLFGSAGVLFALSSIPAIFIHELPGGKAVEKVPTLREFLPDIGRVLRTDGQYRAVLIANVLMGLFAMSGPFYIGFATVTLGLESEVAVPTLLAMQTIGGVSGSLVYIWLGARNNLVYMRLAMVGAVLLPVSALLAGVMGPLPLYAGYLLSGFAATNLGMAFQNWVVSYADADRRPLYSGLFNTIAAFASMASPLIGGLVAQNFGYQPLFTISLFLGLSALFVTLRFLSSRRREAVE